MIRYIIVVYMNNPLVSIVIPVYNVEQYLTKCLETIVHQTYKNIEIVIVNDGSVDRSEEIILKFQDMDKRIKYLKKANGGLSSARNAGIKICTGEFISFVDSDDWVDRDFIRVLMDAIRQDESQIAICNMTYIYKDGEIKKRTPVIETRKAVSNLDALEDLFYARKFKFHAVNKLYAIDLFRNKNIEYPEGKIYEDVFTTYKLFYEAKKVSYVNSFLYFYLQNREGSILQTKFSEKRFGIFEALKNIKCFLEENKIDLNDSFIHLVTGNIISLVNYLYPVYYTLNNNEKKIYLETVKKEAYNFGIDRHIWRQKTTVVEKIRIVMILRHFDLYVKLMKIVKGKL